MPATTRLYENGVVQRVIKEITTGVTLGTTIVPADNTTPLYNEGDAVTGFDTTFTPKYAGSKIRILINVRFSNSSATGNTVVCALFINQSGPTSEAIRTGTATEISTIAMNYQHAHLLYEFNPGSISPIAINVRAGGNSAGTTYINRSSAGADLYNGTMLSYMTVEEII